MKVAYLSLTGNVRRFVERLHIESIELDTASMNVKIDDDYIVILPSYDDYMTDVVCQLIEFDDNASRLRGVAGSGNRNFGRNFIFSAKKLSLKYNKPLLCAFEFSGTDEDIKNFKEAVNQLGYVF